MKKNCERKYKDSDDKQMAKSNIEKKERSCLMCDKMFNSKGPYNRRCPLCEKSIILRKRDGDDVGNAYRISPTGKDCYEIIRKVDN
ncbi:MAG: hypothetical protein ACUZ8O_15140 [Candidatus Anammoxibacter sp.]